MSNMKEENPVSSTCVTDAGTRSYVSPPKSPTSNLQPPLELRSLATRGTQETFWFPMYVTYSRELLVRDALNKEGVKNFLPMEEVTERVGKKIVHSLQPMVHNLIFVYSDRAQLRDLKMFNRDCVHMQFMTIKPRNDEQASVVITIPERQMHNFIRAMEVNDPDHQRSFVPYTDFLGKEGRTVRFVAGPFEGIEGTIKRVNKNRSVVISLPHVGCLLIPIPRITDLQFL